MNNRILECVKKMKEYPQVFRFNVQKNTNISDYFRDKFEAKNLPSDFLDFMSLIDGVLMDNLHLYTITEEGIQVATFERYSSKEYVRNYLLLNGFNPETPYLFIGQDNERNTLAIRLDNYSNSIYILSYGQDRSIIRYESFADLLEERISQALDTFAK